MLAVDTNVLIRYLVRDDEAQYGKARRLIDREAGKEDGVFVSLLVMMEIERVLRSRFGLSKADILGAFSAMLDTVDLAFEDEGSIEQALYFWKEAATDFADCLIGASNQRLGCRATATFDEKALAAGGFVGV